MAVIKDSAMYWIFWQKLGYDSNFILALFRAETQEIMSQASLCQ